MTFTVPPLTRHLDLTGPLGGPVQDHLLGGLQVGEVGPGLHVEDSPAMRQTCSGHWEGRDNISTVQPAASFRENYQNTTPELRQ